MNANIKKIISEIFNIILKKTFLKGTSDKIIRTDKSIKKVYAFGNNTYNQISDVVSDHYNVFESNNIKNVFCGQYNTIIQYDNDIMFYQGLFKYDTISTSQIPKFPNRINNLKLMTVNGDGDGAYISGDSLYVWGPNKSGQLGIGNTIDVKIPQLNKINSDIKNIYDISFGEYMTAIIGYDLQEEKNRLYTCGKYFLGDETTKAGDIVINPKYIEIRDDHNNLVNPVMVKCGAAHVVIACDDDNLYTYGSNAHGQTCHKIKENIKDVDKNRTLNDEYKYHILKPTKVPYLRNIFGIACGMSHTAVIADGRLYTFGSNTNGQCGENSLSELYIPNYDELTGMEIDKHQYAINNGCVKLNGKIIEGVTHVACAYYATFFIAQEKVYIIGRGNINVRELPFTKVTGISCGLDHCAIIAEDGPTVFSLSNV